MNKMSDYNSSWKRNRPRKPLTLDTLKLRLTAAIQEIEEILMTAGDDERQIKIQAANTIAGLSNRYSKLLEVADLEERITQLEEQTPMRKVG